jgi:hypothetical protein
MHAKLWSETQKRRDHFWGLGVDWSIIIIHLKEIERLWTGISWCMGGSGGVF